MKRTSSSLEQVGLLSEDFVACVLCSSQFSPLTDMGVNSLVYVQLELNLSHLYVGL